MSDIEVKASSILEGITVRVRGLSGALLRVKIAQVIFRFGAAVAGCALEIEADDKRR